MTHTQQKTIDFKLDWLEFTYLCPEKYCGLSLWENFMDEFPEFEALINDMVLSERPLFGYTQVLRYNDEFSILYHPDHQEFGVHVTFPAHGLYKLCEIFKLKGDDLTDLADVRSLLCTLKSRGCRFSRMDICWDDYDKTFVPKDFGKWYFDGQISTRTLHMEYIHGYSDTFYLGKRGSDKFLRIYDKEKESNGKINAIRYEFEFRRKFLAMIVDKVINNEEFCIADIINCMFTVKSDYEKSDIASTNSTNKSRASILPEWQEFIDKLFAKRRLSDPVELKVDTKKRDVSFDHKYKWLDRQVFPSMYMLLQCIGKDRLIEVLEANKHRLSKYDEMMLRKYRKEISDDESEFLDR